MMRFVSHHNENSNDYLSTFAFYIFSTHFHYVYLNVNIKVDCNNFKILIRYPKINISEKCRHIGSGFI